MKLASAIEGGLAGATTISLLGETLRKIDGKQEGLDIFDGKNLKKRFKKAKVKKKGAATRQYIRLAGDLLGSTTFLGLTAVGKKKNVLLRGALLGAAAGLGSVLLSERDDEEERSGETTYGPGTVMNDPILAKTFEVGLFTVGGMVAAKLLQKAGGKKKRKR